MFTDLWPKLNWAFLFWAVPIVPYTVLAYCNHPSSLNFKFIEAMDTNA
jgi:hypothetical protein